MHSRIYLIGFMGSGKTTHGKQIARMMGYNFLDLDQYISEKSGRSIPEIFSELGEKAFREMETEAIRETSTIEKLVIATGGGAPCHNENLELLKKSGLVVYLQLSPEALYSRLSISKNPRPLLAGKSTDEIKATIREMLKQREQYYNKADMIIDGLENVNERVVNAIQRK